MTRKKCARQIWHYAFLLAFSSAAAFPAPGSDPSGQAVSRKEAKVYFQDPRTRVPLNSNWRFKRQASPGAATEPEFVGAEQPGYDDSTWVAVTLPHTWDVTSDNPFPPPGHFRGIGWYHRHFDAPNDWQGRRAHVAFKGVFQVADVWVNGHHAGRHVGGFTGFTFDVTDYVKWGASNLLAVRVNNVLDPNIAPANESNVVVYGGIYRSVSIVVTDPAHIEENNPKITIERSGNGTLVHVSTTYISPGPPGRIVRFENLIVDAAGQTSGTLKEQGETESGQIRANIQTWIVPAPHLWLPDSPYLYRIVGTLYAGERAIDRVVTPFGIRFMGYDPAKGFTLNGEPINLHGVNRRQDYGFLGDAVPEAVGVRDIRLIKDLGANFIRTSHYPQDPAILDECDRLGILVWEEIPNIKIYMYPPTSEDAVIYFTERFPRPLMQNLKQQLREMIERDRNHPSIIIWGLADDLSTYHYPEDFVELSNAAHALDPTRWTAGRAPHVTDIIDATSEPDLVRQHRQHPERRYIWNEWGSFISERGREGASVIGREEFLVADSEAALLLEGYMMQWNALPWLGTAKWCMFDAGEPNKAYNRSLWDLPDGKVMLRWPFDDYMGVADMWRLPKEGYYFLQSQWTEKPMLHIVGNWNGPSSGGSSAGLQAGILTARGSSAGLQAGKSPRKRTVRVYSNCDTVELFLNGSSLGAHKPASGGRIWQDFRRAMDQYKSPDEFNQQMLPEAALRHSPFIWDDVPYEPGTLLAVGRKGDTTVRHELRTAGAAARVSLRPEKSTLNADGEDVSFIEADVVDASGITVPDAHPWIRFSVVGPGRLLGGTTEVDAISGAGAINVQSTGQPGEIVVSATSPGLEPGSVQIHAR